jgi:L-fuconolactonase
MIIDSHHHLWYYSEDEYGWIDQSMEVLKKDYLAGDLLEVAGNAGTTATVAVQARQTIEETRWLIEVARSSSIVKGIVGWLDLQSPGLAEQLAEFSGYREMVGVRHIIHDEQDKDFMLKPSFLRGIRALREYNLTYDLLIFPEHLTNSIRLVRANPDQRFVLDHLAKPPIRSGTIQPWKKDIETLAAHPNVWCKVSGMVTEADRNWRYEDFIPYLEVVLEAFGSDRIMIGSDWPVCLLAGSYEEVLKIPELFFDRLSASEKESIFYKNTIECYQLESE